MVGITFSRGEVAELRGAVLTHNHPDGSAFSRKDIGLSIEHGLKEIRAVGITNQGLGTRYRYSIRPEGFAPNEARGVMKIYGRINKDVISEFSASVQDGLLSVADANSNHFHVVCTRLSDFYTVEDKNLNYTREQW